MKLVWTLCFLFVGTLASATPGDERAAAEASLGSGYLMAFPMNDDQVAQESSVDRAKSVAAPVDDQEGDDDDDDEDDDNDRVAVAIPTEQDGKKGVLLVEVDNRKEDEKASNSDEPTGALQTELSSEEGQKEQPLPFFKRPKIEELRKILGFPPAEGSSPKPKPIPPEKPKVFKNPFTKPKAKTESSPLGGLQLALPLRREDGIRPFGLPRFPLRREEGLMRPFGLPDIMQAASSILRRAIMDDNDAQDISKEDKDDDDMMNEPEENEEDDDEEEDEDDEPLMIVPIPDEKDIPEIAQNQQPIFRRFPIPIPIPFPRPVARPRLPIPPLTPVAFFLPLAQQIMHSIMTKPSPPPPPPPPPATPRSHRPFLPLSPVHPIMPLHHPVQQIIPLQSLHHPVQQIIPIHQPVQQILPLHHPMQQIIPLQQPIHQFIPIQSPIMPLPQPTIHIPILTPLPPQMPRPMMRPMPRRVHMPPPPPPMPRRMPIPAPLGRMAGPRVPPGPPSFPHMMRRPIAAGRPMPRMVRPPMSPVHPVLFMMTMPVPMQVPFTHPQQLPQQQPQMSFIHHQPVPVIQQQTVPVAVPDDDRIILLRPNSINEDQDDDQSEILLLYPADEVEEVPRPQMLPRQMIRPLPPPPPPQPLHSVPNPIQRIRLLRDLLLARQANRQAMNPMTPQGRASRVVEIVQQQLRIFPASRNRQSVPVAPNRADSSELHPVYVPYPSSPQ